MKRTLFLSVLVAGVALALAVGAVSVLADKGGPGHGAEHGVATGLQDGGDGVGAQQDGDDDGDGEGAGHVANAIADTFEVPVADVVALHDSGIGFGAIFKLYLLAAAGDGTALAVLDFEEKGEGGFAFGKLFNELTDGVSVLTDGEDGMPKNLGKAVSDLKNDGTEPTVASTDDGDEDDGQGPPEHAPAHGLNRD